MKVTVIPIVIGALEMIPRLNKRMRGVGNWMTSRDHLNYSMVEVSQNTEKSPGDLRRLTITQTQVKDHQLSLV